MFVLFSLISLLFIFSSSSTLNFFVELRFSFHCFLFILLLSSLSCYLQFLLIFILLLPYISSDLHFLLLFHFSDPSPLNSRRPSNDSIGAWNSYIRNNLKHESTSVAFLSEAALNLAASKKNKLSSKHMKKVNFEDSEKDGPPVIEGGRVTASLVKVDK